MMRNLFAALLFLFVSVSVFAHPLPPEPSDPQHLMVCHSGQWFDPAYSGNGIDLEVLQEGVQPPDATQPTTAAVSWFTFTSYDNPAWYITDNVPVQSNDADGSFVYTFHVGQAHGTYWKPADSVTEVGTLSLTVHGWYSLSMDWHFTAASGYCSGFSPENPFCNGHRDLVPLANPLPCSP